MKIRNLYAEEIDDSEWDGFEVHPMIILTDDKGNQWEEQCDEGDKPDFYTLFIHLKNGGIQSVADVDTLVDAIELQVFITELIKKQNVTDVAFNNDFEGI